MINNNQSGVSHRTVIRVISLTNLVYSKPDSKYTKKKFNSVENLFFYINVTFMYNSDIWILKNKENTYLSLVKQFS